MTDLVLKRTNFQELDANEMMEIDGGIAPFIIGGLIVIGILWPLEAK